MVAGDDAPGFPHEWRAEALSKSPLIAPARQFTYPQQVAGEEDALARGALLVQVHPAAGGSFLATCALGFTDAAMPTGIFACPNPRELCAVAGGYAYVVDTAEPERSTHIALKPVAQVLVLAEDGLLVFVGFHSMVAWGREGLAWQTGRLSWEGIRVSGIQPDGQLHGFGWNMPSDKEMEFAVDLRTGAHTGGGF
ncbi:MAG TPA: hypothetical protein VGN01_08405 [Acidobacteriaceae bacterium]|jgi:hypothetical protein